MSSLEGILPIHKPEGFTSHDVVAKVRGILRMKRIGHTGTLDPQVTGVLPLCLGRATRVVEYLQELPKEYEATLILGIATDTEDMTGTVTSKVDGVHVTEEQVREALKNFVGTIAQIPPMYSALKQNGKRLYELAREGKVVERQAREVEIYKLDVTNLNLNADSPSISFRVLCSKGTYIRTLCVDIGQALGVPAVMSDLKRTMSASIPLERCLTFEEVQQAVHTGNIQDYLIPVDQAVSYLPAHEVQEDKVKSALQGQKLSASVIHPPVQGQQLIRLYSPAKQFLGLFQWNEDKGAISAVKVFLPEDS
ncbi:tRNA pseudouridine55 synthase [Paenibacillus shirakamiensis]|uniref:tRNA pseudouridine synthase B n=1 Tax=Paenibacillus shirakamiensis TaxID=1265935 RepID=A0ABS4JJA0_9BACL|nr:tRNA pseudouridine(55) synthase TruB [Paenibacillus shirakamiensis]MBP2001071.1 tRNA pseudouridine55 synthase [Paenibacillus shirakamiensis]